MATLSAQHDDDSPSCFNTIPWHKQRIYNRGTTGKKKYTDADLAADMNALSFKERSEVEEDIHGVSNVIPETDEFVDAKIKELKESLKNMPRSANRIAWDRACFLRPSLETDRAHYLMFLRARRFVAFDAATLLLKFYEIKEELWGESMVMQRITWRDLNAQEQEFAKRGVYQFLTKRDSTGRAIGYHRVRQYDLRNSRNNALVKSFIYLYLAGLQANPEVQKRGVVSIVDFRGTEPKMDMDADVAPYFASISHIGDSLPHHLGATHLIYDEPTADFSSFLQGIRARFTRVNRVRNRMHYGSPLEIEYALKSYGINLAGCLELPNGGGEQELSGPLSRRELEEHIRRLEENEEEWRQKEAPYRDSSSPIALFPNPQDIIMGKSRKKLAATFPGNLAFNKIIKAQALHYSNEEERGFKTAIVMGVIHHLQNDLGARFLTRKDTCWEVVDATEVRQKVSQALRDEVKLIMKHRKQRCE